MRSLLGLVLALALGAPARADVKPHPIFADHMVLQQGAEIVVWGKADPKENVAAELSLRTAGSTTTAVCSVLAGEDGSWKAAIMAKEIKPGTGYTLTVKGKGNKVEFKNVAV